MTDIHDLSATELLQRYRAKTLSPTEVFAAVEKHIARWEPHLKALYAYEPEAARKEAAASTERWAKGAPMGPLDGVPVTVKENIASKGVPMPLGTAAMPLTPMAQDAPPTARLREAGAIIFSKTTMPDFGMTSSGVSSFHPLTRNPWDLSKNPGGSSSGAGAAGAAGYGPLHVGTDIGGSVRLPSGWCGLVGLKPSLGRIPIDPPYVARCAGPMTRTVDDTALMMSVLAKPDHRDGMSLPVQDIDWTNLSGSVKGKRIGLLLDAGVGMPVDPEVKAAVENVAKYFAGEGAAVEPVQGIISRAILDGLDTFFRARSWGDIELLPAEQRAKIHPYTRQWAEGGAKALRHRCRPRLQPEHGAAPACGPPVRQDRLSRFADRADPGVSPRSAPHRATIPNIRSSTSASRCRGISPSSRRSRSTLPSRSPACRSACRSSAAASTTTAC